MSESGFVSRLDVTHHFLEFADIGFERFAAVEADLARYKVYGLNAVCSLINRCDARIAKMLGRAGFFDISHAAMDLNALRCHFHADIRGISLRDGGKKRRT